MLKDTVYKLVRQLSGTPSVTDGIRRLLPQLGQHGILPGLLVDSFARKGERRTSADMEKVVSSLEKMGLGSSGVFPKSQADFYRRQQGMSRDMLYYNADEENPLSSIGGSTSAARPDQPVRPIRPASGRTFTVRRPTRIINPTVIRSPEGRRRIEQPTPLPECWGPVVSLQSSHLYSCQYNKCSKQCVITFRTGKGSPLEEKNTIPSTCSGIVHQWLQKPTKPGLSYLYGNPSNPFPEVLFDALTRAPSPGRFLWENIRGCGDQSPFPDPIIFDQEIDGGIFLPTNDGSTTSKYFIPNSPSPPPR